MKIASWTSFGPAEAVLNGGPAPSRVAFRSVKRAPRLLQHERRSFHANAVSEPQGNSRTHSKLLRGHGRRHDFLYRTALNFWSRLRILRYFIPLAAGQQFCFRTSMLTVPRNAVVCPVGGNDWQTSPVLDLDFGEVPSTRVFFLRSGCGLPNFTNDNAAPRPQAVSSLWPRSKRKGRMLPGSANPH